MLPKTLKSRLISGEPQTCAGSAICVLPLAIRPAASPRCTLRLVGSDCLNSVLKLAKPLSVNGMPMLAAITKISNEFDVVHQCAVEESMACGIGICMTCVLPVENEDGSTSMLRSCIDGPVMDGSKVLWDQVGQHQ